MFSGRTLDALAEVITGGASNSSTPSIGNYRSAYYLERFFQNAGHDFQLANRSRVPATRDFLAELATGPNGAERIVKLMEHVADPKDFIGEPAKNQAVVDHLNLFLEFDDHEIVLEKKRARVRKKGPAATIIDAFTSKTIALNFEAVRAEVDRALESADRDPPVAVTAACVIIESVCRSILAEMQIPAPSKRDVEALLRAVQDPLGLSPARSDLPDLIASDVKQVLGGLTTVAKGVGALRTHGGSAHATEHGQAPVDARIARFAIHSASTIALFLVETWERKKRRDQRQAKGAV